MKVRQTCGQDWVEDFSDLGALLERLPWLRPHAPADLPEAARLINRLSSAHLAEVSAPTSSPPEGGMDVLVPPRPTPLDAVRWLLGAQEAPPPQACREALVRADGDPVLAALGAFGEHAGDVRVAAVLAWMCAAGRPAPQEEEVALAPPEMSGAEPALSAFRRAWRAGQVHRSPGGGYRARDPEGGCWDWVPDAPGRSAAASRAFGEVAASWGVRSVGPPCSVLDVGGVRGAASPSRHRDLEDLTHLRAAAVSGPRVALGSTLASGELHRWLALDWVLGNPDRTPDCVLAEPSGARSALLPAHACLGVLPFGGAGTFVPAYARAWAPEPWCRLSPEERWSRWPSAPSALSGELAAWFAGLSPDPVRQACASAGLDAEPACARLRALQAASASVGLDLALRAAWLSPDHSLPT